MVRHRKDVGLSKARKSPGQDQFLGLLPRVRAPGASNERHGPGHHVDRITCGLIPWHRTYRLGTGRQGAERAAARRSSRSTGGTRCRRAGFGFPNPCIGGRQAPSCRPGPVTTGLVDGPSGPYRFGGQVRCCSGPCPEGRLRTAPVSRAATERLPGRAHGGSESCVVEITGFREVGVDRVLLKDHEHFVQEITERASDPLPVRLGGPPASHQPWANSGAPHVPASVNASSSASCCAVALTGSTSPSLDHARSPGGWEAATGASEG
ncbi:hypothetical protein SUDANB70_01393 [Streptomyces sp. enrichment culture]